MENIIICGKTTCFKEIKRLEKVAIKHNKYRTIEVIDTHEIFISQVAHNLIKK
jgi:hypothetical protein